MQAEFDRFKREAEPLLEKLAELTGNSVVFPLLFHLQANIVPWTVSQAYDFLHKLGSCIEGNLDAVLFSTGGNADSAFHLAKILHRMTKGTLSFIVPRCAASAATLMALAGDNILMGPPSELGPIDPQIEISPNRFVSSRSLRETFDLLLGKIIEHPELPEPTVNALVERLPLIELVDYERLLEHVEELAIDLLNLRMVKDMPKAQEISKKLVREFKYHERVISLDDAVALGLNAREPPLEQWDIIWEFHKKWETVAMITAEEGSNILSLGIGNGVAFIPSKKAGKEKGEESPLSTILLR